MRWDLNSLSKIKPVKCTIECHTPNCQDIFSDLDIDTSMTKEMSIVNVHGEFTPKTINLIPTNVEKLQLFCSELSDSSRELLIQKLKSCPNLDELIISSKSREKSELVTNGDKLLEAVTDVFSDTSIKTLTLAVNVNANTIELLAQKALQKKSQIVLSNANFPEIDRIVEIVIKYKEILSFANEVLPWLDTSDSKLAELYKAFPESREIIANHSNAKHEVLSLIIDDGAKNDSLKLTNPDILLTPESQEAIKNKLPELNIGKFHITAAEKSILATIKHLPKSITKISIHHYGYFPNESSKQEKIDFSNALLESLKGLPRLSVFKICHLFWGVNVFDRGEWKESLQPIYNLVAANQTRLKLEELKINSQVQEQILESEQIQEKHYQNKKLDDEIMYDPDMNNEDTNIIGADPKAEDLSMHN